jgi:DNA/RNA-binding domain of Phe-tRNA-synthetase-like protein
MMGQPEGPAPGSTDRRLSLWPLGGPPTDRPLGAVSYLFTPIEDETIDALTERYRGQGDPPLAPGEFEKRPEVTWPCVILELSGLEIRRKVKTLERWKEEMLAAMDPDALERSPRLLVYDELLGERDRGNRKVSVRNLLEMLRRDKKLPNINTLVDIYNHTSLAHTLVMGAYERRTIKGKLIYAAASGKEHFIPVKGADREPIAPGEWVLKDETDMVVTKVATKQSEAAAVTTATRQCVMCIQGSPLTPVAELERIAVEMAQRIVDTCQGSYRVVFSG